MKQRDLRADTDARLACLARAFLRILEAHEEWNGDTFDELALAANRRGMSEACEHGLFRVTDRYADTVWRGHDRPKHSDWKIAP